MELNLFKRTPGQAEMSFIEHLEALRWHIVRSVLAVVVLAIFAFVKIDWIFENIIMGPLKSDFLSVVGLCKLSHFLHIGDTLCLPAANVQLGDFRNWRRFEEILLESRRLINQRTIRGHRRIGQRLHGRFERRQLRGRIFVRQKRCFQRRRDHKLEIAPPDFRIADLARDHFALLGRADLAVLAVRRDLHRAGRQRRIRQQRPPERSRCG